ncbi:hypothetical protein R0131_11010 [Clostridium sp. AL.422]|uniref:hypothetical protein n=1 Tax=Clostridium TaxID=1485 RepID=UPI00293DD2BD|nr:MULTISPECIES: hypothetical protein [unclassified Clostridium]MDV4151370.1 hypothetical protein [Clostridium sp. AL.422]
MNLEVISKIDFDKIINIKFNNILDGFKKYSHIELSPINEEDEEDENKFIRTIERFYEINEGNLIVDFYKEKLNYESIKYIKSNLDLEDNVCLDEILDFTNENDYFYKVKNKKYLRLLTKLCTRELFFITFYFYKNPVTLWGNYNLKFPLFYDDSTNIIDYISISKINKLY